MPRKMINKDIFVIFLIFMLFYFVKTYQYDNTGDQMVAFFKNFCGFQF